MTRTLKEIESSLLPRLIDGKVETPEQPNPFAKIIQLLEQIEENTRL